ncbi:hypothetical protein Dsin_029173 [Dipteronia sinensis]|uniref:Zinc knuckle CX2CX4HX4C domain-containing protein n=1 Tax=Dipteronia sinensis TaxID=43782 RepID=A0AAE0DW88_9ROSI|nr:hypothetical protein Dsin_029173 [Dipteronia sinensis]
MDLEIVKLYEHLSLANEDGAIHEMSEEAQRDGVADVDHCLVGKVLSGKNVNMEAFKGLIVQLWSQFGIVEIESVDKFDNIVMVRLKYERLPEFCYVCGNIGHMTKEYLDVEARTQALTGMTTKLGSWMRGLILDIMKVRHLTTTIRSSTEKDRPLEGRCERGHEDSLNQEADLLGSQKRVSSSTEAVSRKVKVGAFSSNQIPTTGFGPNSVNELHFDGPLEASVSETAYSGLGIMGNNSISVVAFPATEGPPRIMIGLSWNGISTLVSFWRIGFGGGFWDSTEIPLLAKECSLGPCCGVSEM